MKTYEVEIFNMNNPTERHKVEVTAGCQDDAERIAISGGIINNQNGWGVFDSKEI